MACGPDETVERSHVGFQQVRRGDAVVGMKWGEQAGGSGDRPPSYPWIGTAVHGFARRLRLTNWGGSEFA